MATRTEKWKIASVISRLSITNKTFEQELIDMLNDLVPLTINNELKDLLMQRINVYKKLYYDFLPIEYEIQPIEDDENIAREIAQFSIYMMVEHLSHYTPILLNATTEFNSLKDVSFKKEGSKTYANEETTGGTYAMNEISPIDADINSITTPHMKSQAESGGTKEYLNPESYEEINPYYYEKYLQILEKYNIPNIIIESVIKGIYEFNRLV